MKPVRTIRRLRLSLRVACLALTVLLLANPLLAFAGSMVDGCIDCACGMSAHGGNSAGAAHGAWRSVSCCADPATPCHLSAATSTDVLPAALHTAPRPPLPSFVLLPASSPFDRSTPSPRRIAAGDPGTPRGAPARYLDVCRLII